MIEGPFFALTLLAALGCGLIAGVFFAFSTSVMRTLGALPWKQGLTAMQKLNVLIINPVFLGVFVGTAVLSVVVAVMTFVIWPDEGAWELLIGCALYLVGCFGVTVAANIPRNEALDKLDPEAPESAEQWKTYVKEWTVWNHVRGGGALAACAALVLALAA
ncbi:DUF1772 domain-containing protein [Streptomyces sp. YC504]|uniref:DUF1772 domain-containing protein n=1 Tax=Streptomyces mesophilus TaxID=1775132 RepID=A0A6G4XVW9_9ACTN|nr:anthrone oxygenase family protein [Streptomyces mesophilus]NGO81726.1 DUF1772 domain-containing protein [Streptomyces mesophilus]